MKILLALLAFAGIGTIMMFGFAGAMEFAAHGVTAYVVTSISACIAGLAVFLAVLSAIITPSMRVFFLRRNSCNL